MANNIPAHVKKYFWGDNLNQLNWQKHKHYIAQTLLNKGDEKSISWLLEKINVDQLKKLIPQLKLNPKSKNFWKIYLS